ncbi:MAG: hypothetical protein UZ07_CHB004002987 [Chlorobi bacterium OLB7]|nr:MAG: hypothetical protein UZ07_CHB004002987 [Chlorobi bacterium OLB7]
MLVVWEEEFAENEKVGRKGSLARAYSRRYPFGSSITKLCETRRAVR